MEAQDVSDAVQHIIVKSIIRCMGCNELLVISFL